MLARNAFRTRYKRAVYRESEPGNPEPVFPGNVQFPTRPENREIWEMSRDEFYYIKHFFPLFIISVLSLNKIRDRYKFLLHWNDAIMHFTQDECAICNWLRGGVEDVWNESIHNRKYVMNVCIVVSKTMII